MKIQCFTSPCHVKLELFIAASTWLFMLVGGRMEANISVCSFIELLIFAVHFALSGELGARQFGRLYPPTAGKVSTVGAVCTLLQSQKVKIQICTWGSNRLFVCCWRAVKSWPNRKKDNTCFSCCRPPQRLAKCGFAVWGTHKVLKATA